MTALRCDICKAYFDTRSTKEAAENKTCNRIAMGAYSNRGHYFSKLECDICPDCYAAIKKTIDDRRKITINPNDDDLK